MKWLLMFYAEWRAGRYLRLTSVFLRGPIAELSMFVYQSEVRTLWLCHNSYFLPTTLAASLEQTAR
jgi:hypothetical protein